MKKTLLWTLSLIALISMMCSSVLSASAAEEVKVNGISAKPGDIITYTVRINDLKTDVSAVNGSVKYNDSDFALISGDDSNSAIVIGSGLQSVVYNETYENEFLFNAANGVQGFDFSKDNMIISLSFKVLDTAAETADISFSFVEIYDMDPKDLVENTDYTVETSTELNVYEGTAQIVDKNKPSINLEGDTVINPTGIDPNDSIKVDDITDSPTSSIITSVVIPVIIAVIIIAMIIILIFVKKPENKTEE